MGTQSKNNQIQVGTTTPTLNSSINHQNNQPVLSHLISVPYIIPSKQKRAIERNAQFKNNNNVNHNPKIEVMAPQSNNNNVPQMTDSELLQASIARENLMVREQVL